MLLTAGTLLAQHTYSPSDIEDGGRLYRSTCVTCHGPDGDLVAGVDLGHGKFRRANTDEGLIAIIRTGIPGTAMPPNNFTEFQAGTIVAYLRSLATAGRSTTGLGDPVRGKAIFEGKGQCMNCHRVRGQGARLGPDLSDIGTLRRPAELEKSILDPDAEILPQNRTVRAVTKDGQTITGHLMNEDTFTVEVLDTHDRLRLLQRSNLSDFAFVDKSPMPSYQGKLNQQELGDLVGYLSSLKGVEIK